MVFVVVSGLLFTIVGFFLSKDFDVRKSLHISQPVDKIHSLVGDLSQWEKWYLKPDAETDFQITLSEQTQGAGATMRIQVEENIMELAFVKYDPATGVEFEISSNQSSERLTFAITYSVSGTGTDVQCSTSGRVDTFVVGGYIAMLMANSYETSFDYLLQSLSEAVAAEA